MTHTSPLNNIYEKGFFGDYEDKNENDLLKLSENKNFLIVQIVQYKNSTVLVEKLKIDDLDFKNKALKVSSNNNTRILWNGPRNWVLISSKKELIKEIFKIFNDKEFAITDLSHSKAIVELEGVQAKEVLKKGCPFDFNELNKDNCLNSTFNGISITADVLHDNPYKIRVMTLRSFGESLYHSITDSCLEFGYKNL
ncbi:sarcosine oxidase [Candidatus Pelagibacter sp.]|nr:sarcosine oxidase [Candidatus Pelagibacter sp.]MDC0569515.1 sarcosine oxidase [Candidatus Pelagibacter sp.]